MAAKVENTCALDYPTDKLDIVVCSDGSTDRTAEIAEGFCEAGVHALRLPIRRGKATTLNEAIMAVQGQLICLCDANVMLQPSALRRMVERLADPAVGAVSGDVRLASHQSNFGAGERLYYRIERLVHRGESRMGSMMGVDGGMYVIRRDLFQPLAPDTILDDFVISMRVIRQGKRVVYEPTAVATENGTPTASQEFRRRVRVTAGAVQALKRGEFPPLLRRPVEFYQFASHKLLRWFSPVWLIVFFVANALLWPAGPLYQATMSGQIALYTFAAAATVSLRLRETRVGGTAFYFVMSHVAMAVGLVKGLFNLQPVTWQKADRVCDGAPRAVAAVHTGVQHRPRDVGDRQTSSCGRRYVEASDR